MPRLRKAKLIPQQVSDIGAFFFVVCMIPLTYIWEVGVIVPKIYPEASISWFIHMFLGALVTINITGNFLGLWLVDTSTRFIVIPSSQVGHKWHFCATCEAVAPPRSWHCGTCGICVLKREHHCMFAGYCVGHANHRYFIMFLAWLWTGVLYCCYFNTLYLWVELGLLSTLAALKFIFPLMILVTGMDISWGQVAIFFWSVHLAAFLLTSVLLVYHVKLITAGQTTFESNRKITDYNLGTKQNLMEVLGARWYLAMVWPFASSKLPHNGVEWDTQETWQLEGPKHR